MGLIDPNLATVTRHYHSILDPPPIYASKTEFEKGLSKMIEIIGSLNISTDEDTLKSHNDSFFNSPSSKTRCTKPSAIIYPTSTQQVSKLLKIAHEFSIPIVANSGLTSIEGQNIHTRGPYSISISFNKMNQILEFHPEDLDIVVQSGVCWQDLNDYLSNHPNGNHLMFDLTLDLGLILEEWLAQVSGNKRI